MLKFSKIAIATLGLLSLAACNDNKQTEQVIIPEVVDNMVAFEVTVSNLTNAQPFSPLTLLLHDEGSAWEVGSAAADGLEKLAESGDNSTLIANDFAISSSSNDKVLPYGQTDSVTVSSSESVNYLSLLTMLVNTNDAFSGLNKVDISQLAVNQSLRYTPGAYDAGTEGNSEEAGTIPGPADGGEGYNMARDDINVVTMHSGIISSDDGLVNSVLSFEHKFDNPVMLVTITRIK